MVPPGLPLLATWLALLGVAVGAVRGRRAAGVLVEGLRPTTALGVLGVMALHLGIVRTVVTPGPWHSFHHGVETWAWLTLHGALEDAEVGVPHGTGAYAWIRLAQLLDPDPFGAVALLSTLGVGLAFLTLRALLEDDAWALGAAAVLAFLPARLRLAHTETIYVAVEVAVWVALLAAEVHLRRRTPGSFVVAALALAVAMTSHLEVMVLGPAFVLAWVTAREPAWLAAAVRQRWFWLGLVLLVAVAGVQLLRLQQVRVGALPGAASAVHPSAAHARGLALGVGALLLAFAWVRPARDAALGAVLLRGVRWLGVGAALGLLVFAVRALRALPPDAFLRVDEAGLAAAGTWPQVHLWFDASRTVPAWPPLLVAGLVLLALHRPVALRVVAAALLVCAWVYAGAYDVPSTYVRTALLPAFWLAAPTGVALVEALRALGVARASAAGAVALALLAAAPYEGVLRWRYPSQVEFDLLVVARDAGGAVVVPTVQDVPEGVDAERFSLDRRRRYLQDVFADRTRLGWREALVEDATGAVWVGTLDCVRAHTSLDARTWLWGGRVVGLPAGAVPPVGEVERMDPLCTALRERYRLEPLAEADLPRGSLFLETFPVGARLGVYRILGPRSGTLSPP